MVEDVCGYMILWDFQVVPGALLRSCKEGPHIGYSLLGCPIQTEPITDITAPHYPAERANAKILSLPVNILQYFKQHSKLEVYLMIGEIALACASVDISNLASLEMTNSTDTSPDTEIKIEGAFELSSVKSLASSILSNEDSHAIVGLSIELSKIPKNNNEVSNRTYNDKDVAEDTKDKSQLNEENKSVKKKIREHLKECRKRRRQDSSNGCTDAEDSLLLRSEVQERLRPDNKRQKLNAAESSSQAVQTNEEFQKWRESQESVFWKQVSIVVIILFFSLYSLLLNKY